MSQAIVVEQEFERVTVRIPAKINLHLGVGALREDGYHDLATVYQAVSLHDEVSVSRKSPGSGITVTADGPFAEHVPVDMGNLAVRAAARVAAHYGHDLDLHIGITKSIPVAAGLAGGSADAAGALLATDALFGSQLSREELHRFAAEIGSDVPFSLTGGTAIGMGRGEVLTPAMARGTFHWVLIASNMGLSTPAVYAELDRLRGHRAIPAPQIPSVLMQALVAHDPVALGQSLGNDLQDAALSLRPSLGTRVEMARDLGALGVIVSGSGPTIAILVRDEEQALDVTVALASHGVNDPILRVHGPVPGARIVESI